MLSGPSKVGRYRHGTTMVSRQSIWTRSIDMCVWSGQGGVRMHPRSFLAPQFWERAGE